MARKRKAMFLLLAALAATLAAPAALAQGCAMCLQNAAASGPEGARAINYGILFLLVPSLALFGGVAFLALRARGALTPEAPAAAEPSLEIESGDETAARARIHLTFDWKDHPPQPRA